MSSLPNASRAMLSITGSVYPRCTAFTTLASLPLPLCSPLTLYRHSEWQTLVTSSLQPSLGPGSADCTFRRLASFKKWEEKKAKRREWERENRRKRRESDVSHMIDKRPLSFYLFCRFYCTGGPLSPDRERTVCGEWIFLPNILVYICIRVVRAESEQIQYPGNRLNDSRAIPQLVRQGRRYIVIYCP